MSRRVLTYLAVLGASLCLIAARPKTPKNPVFRQIDSIVQTLSDITGLSEEHPVGYGWISKNQLRHFLAKRIKKTLKPEEIYTDELALKMFGLVPQDFDLRKSTINLLTEQAAAFYDYDEKKLFLLNDSTFEDETTTLAHELAHALADQHFDLDKFMDETPANDDENLAHTAVVEGQASWLMLAYDLKEAGRPPVPTAEMLKTVVDSSDTSMADYPVLKGSPLYIQQSLLFPYTQGTLFFDAVYKRLGKQAFSAVFTDAPVDSAQVMHPEKYFAHEKSAKPELPKLSLHQQTELTQGSVGEFDHDMLLRQYVGEAEAEQLTPHVRGGQFQIFATGKQHRPVLAYVSQWDSDERAADFFAAYQKILRAKWKRCDFSQMKPNVIAGTGDNGYFITRLAGNTVSSIEGVGDFGEWAELLSEPRPQAALRMRFGLRASTLR